MPGSAGGGSNGGRGARTSVLLLTPVALYRDGIARYLAASGAIDVVGVSGGSTSGRAFEGPSGPSLVSLAKAARPDVILLDMALEDSGATARALRWALPSTPIIALAVPESEPDVLRCAEVGVSGYVSRDASLEDLLTAVGSAVSGEAICSPRIAASLFRRIAALSFAAQEHEETPRLTPREAEIVALIDDGLSNKQIARRLSIEVPTVKNHVHSVLEKLGASSRTEAAARVRGRRI